MMKDAFEISTTAAGTEGILTLSGDVTMVEASETREVVLKAIEAVETLHLDLAGIESVDVSFIQLICAAHRECYITGKKIVLQDGPGQAMEDLLERAGYNKQLGCTSDAKKSCLWGQIE